MPHARHTLHAHQHHIGWDNAIPPVLTVAPGSRVAIDCPDSSDGQLTAASTVADVGRLDFGRINPVVGPVFIDGAEPGDAVKITIGEFQPSGFGWTANIPGFGLLADQFAEPALKLWSYDRVGMTPDAFSPVARVPLKPFAGTIGLALAEPGPHSVVPPRRVGGNLDIRDLTPARCCTCRWRSRAGCSRSATRMPRRATARSAAPRSRVRWRWR